jgi:hypothetical protein
MQREAGAGVGEHTLEWVDCESRCRTLKGMGMLSLCLTHAPSLSRQGGAVERKCGMCEEEPRTVNPKLETLNHEP